MSPAALESNKNSNDNPVEKFRMACAIRRLVTPNLGFFEMGSIVSLEIRIVPPCDSLRNGEA
jgi:hypothetical protein